MEKEMKTETNPVTPYMKVNWVLLSGSPPYTFIYYIPHTPPRMDVQTDLGFNFSSRTNAFKHAWWDCPKGLPNDVETVLLGYVWHYIRAQGHPTTPYICLSCYFAYQSSGLNNILFQASIHLQYIRSGIRIWQKATWLIKATFTRAHFSLKQSEIGMPFQIRSLPLLKEQRLAWLGLPLWWELVLADAVLTSTLNLCFEQKFEKYQFLSENFYFLVVKFSVYLSRHIFVMVSPVNILILI